MRRGGGYLGVLMGSVGGVYASYTAFGQLAVYGILALIFYDTFSALIGTAFGKHKLPYTSSTVEGGAIGGLLVYAAVLSIFNFNILDLIVLGIVAVLSEAYGVEDNLTIPIFTSLAAFLLGMPTIL